MLEPWNDEEPGSVNLAKNYSFIHSEKKECVLDFLPCNFAADVLFFNFMRTLCISIIIRLFSSQLLKQEKDLCRTHPLFFITTELSAQASYKNAQRECTVCFHSSTSFASIIMFNKKLFCSGGDQSRFEHYKTSKHSTSFPFTCCY